MANDIIIRRIATRLGELVTDIECDAVTEYKIEVGRPILERNATLCNRLLKERRKCDLLRGIEAGCIATSNRDREDYVGEVRDFNRLRVDLSDRRNRDGRVEDGRRVGRAVEEVVGECVDLLFSVVGEDTRADTRAEGCLETDLARVKYCRRDKVDVGVVELLTLNVNLRGPRRALGEREETLEVREGDVDDNIFIRRDCRDLLTIDGDLDILGRRVAVDVLECELYVRGTTTATATGADYNS